jgi:hypothetical protein
MRDFILFPPATDDPLRAIYLTPFKAGNARKTMLTLPPARGRMRQFGGYSLARI